MEENARKQYPLSSEKGGARDVERIARTLQEDSIYHSDDIGRCMSTGNDNT